MGAGSERMEKYSYVHMTAFPFELMIALMHMIGEGVFDRFPASRWPTWRAPPAGCPSGPSASTSTSRSCAPSGGLPAQAVGDHQERPGHVHLRAGGDDPARGAGDDRPHQVMYASDYAHWDSEFPESVRLVASIPGLTDEQKRRVLGRNAVAWFGLTLAELPRPRSISSVRRCQCSGEKMSQTLT